jgi:ABC-type transport system involved in cytochrome c biogenesis permease subunit
LSTGSSLSGALRLAKADAVANGRPAAAWAGVVLLGDGTLVPIPGGSDPEYRTTAVIGVLATGALFVFGLVYARRAWGRHRGL